MKFLICGDLHYRGSNPRARTDNFQAALGKKLAEALTLAIDHDAAMIIAGDIFDSPAPSYSVFSDLAQMLRGHDVPVFTVPGNHDLFGHSLESMGRTAYDALHRLYLVRDLARFGVAPEQWGPAMRMPLDDGVALYGNAYTTETDVGMDTYLVSQARRQQALKEGRDITVLVAHGMALTDKPGFEMRHTLLKDIAMHEDAPCILIVGHEHLGFGARWYPKADGTEMLAINPGALCRLSAHPGEIERTVQVCLLEIHGKVDGLLKCDVELIPLASAKPGHEVLSRLHLEQQAQREERMTKFLDLLAAEGELTFLEVTQIVEDLARRENIPPEIVKEALQRIGKARENMGVA